MKNSSRNENFLEQRRGQWVRLAMPNLSVICRFGLRDLQDARSSRHPSESTLLHTIQVLTVRSAIALSDLNEHENELIARWVLSITGCTTIFVPIKSGRDGEHDTYRDLVFQLETDTLKQTLVFSRPQSDGLHNYHSVGRYLKYPCPRLVTDVTEISLDSSALSACESDAVVARKADIVKSALGFAVAFEGYRIVVMEERWTELLEQLAGLSLQQYSIVYDSEDDLETILSLLAHHNPYFLHSISLTYLESKVAVATPIFCKPTPRVERGSYGREAALFFGCPSSERKRVVGRDAFRSSALSGRLRRLLRDRAEFRCSCFISRRSEMDVNSAVTGERIVVAGHVGRNAFDVVSIYARERLLRLSGALDLSAISELVSRISSTISETAPRDFFREIDVAIRTLEISDEYAREQKLIQIKRRIFAALNGQYVDGPDFRDCSAALEYLMVVQEIETHGSISAAKRSLGFQADSALYTYLKKGKRLGIA